MAGKGGWLGFCKQLKIPPIYAEVPSKEQAEFDTVLLLLYAAWKIPKMKAGKGRGAEIDSAYQYISSIKSAMNKEVGGQREVQVNQSWLKSQFNGGKGRGWRRRGLGNGTERTLFAVHIFNKCGRYLGWIGIEVLAKSGGQQQK